MPTLSELEAAARRAHARYVTQRDRLTGAENEARDAIRRHAHIHAQVIGGAGTQDDVDAAAASRDEAIARLEVIRAELL